LLAVEAVTSELVSAVIYPENRENVHFLTALGELGSDFRWIFNGLQMNSLKKITGNANQDIREASSKLQGI